MHHHEEMELAMKVIVYAWEVLNMARKVVAKGRVTKPYLVPVLMHRN